MNLNPVVKKILTLCLDEFFSYVAENKNVKKYIDILIEEKNKEKEMDKSIATMALNEFDNLMTKTTDKSSTYSLAKLDSIRENTDTTTIAEDKDKVLKLKIYGRKKFTKEEITKILIEMNTTVVPANILTDKRITTLIEKHIEFDQYVDYSDFGTILRKGYVPQFTKGGRKESKGESICRASMYILTGKVYKSIRPDWLKNPLTGKNLELDLYEEKDKVALEYNGSQHYSFEDLSVKNSQRWRDYRRRLQSTY